MRRYMPTKADNKNFCQAFYKKAASGEEGVFMRIITLVENVTPGGPLGGAHGLSLYVETPKHRILFDAGPDGALLLKNAAALGVDLSTVDIAVLSHGHQDHAGGLRAFMGNNTRATLYMHREATRGHLSMGRDGAWNVIGVDSLLLKEHGDRIVFTDDGREIDNELLLFSDVLTDDLIPASNATLYEEGPDGPAPDAFGHEQNLLVRSDGKAVLFAGCAHRGIVNVLRRAEDILGHAPDHVLAGFHLTNPGRGTAEPEDFVHAVGAELSARPDTVYITGHCTGLGPYTVLLDVLGRRLQYMSAGTVFEL